MTLTYWKIVQGLIEKKVEKIYSILFNVLTNLELYPRDAKVNQGHILADRDLV